MFRNLVQQKGIKPFMHHHHALFITSSLPKRRNRRHQRQHVLGNDNIFRPIILAPEGSRALRTPCRTREVLQMEEGVMCWWHVFLGGERAEAQQMNQMGKQRKTNPLESKERKHLEGA